MTPDVEVLVLRERVRGLENLVAQMREHTASIERAHEMAAEVTSGLGFKVLGRAALASAEADEPLPDTAPIVQVPQITWFGEQRTGDAPDALPITTSEA